MSVALVPELAAAEAWRLGLATALAVAEACEAVAPVDLKWPNDIVAAADGRKVGGLLIETMAEGDRLSGAVLGIGINVNWQRAEMPPELQPDATSLADLAGGPVDREALLDRLLNGLEAEIASIEAGDSPLERYRARCSTLGLGGQRRDGRGNGARPRGRPRCDRRVGRRGPPRRSPRRDRRRGDPASGRRCSA